MVAKTNQKSLSSKKKLLGAAVLFVAVVACGLGTYFYRNLQIDQQKPPQETVLSRISKGQQPLNNAATRQQLESSLAHTSGQDRYQTLLLLGNEYLAAKDYAKAAAILKQADQSGVATNPDLTFSIAMAAQAAGDKAEALTYYKKTRDLLTSSKDVQKSAEATTFLQQVNVKISELGG